MKGYTRVMERKPSAWLLLPLAGTMPVPVHPVLINRTLLLGPETGETTWFVTERKRATRFVP